jgi:GT2 family glycosyltransferase
MAEAREVGVVVIGRNEGERLRRCLLSVQAAAPGAIVYADSGSSDGSAALARALGATVVELDERLPFTAARGRNAGFDRLHATSPGIRYVQFIDGDCELEPGWLGAAQQALEADRELVLVAGWLREREPGRSIYNRLAELEWNQSGTGDVDWVGGIFLVRAAVFASARGFDPNLAAGEEPELCLRLAAAGWRLRRLDAAMAIHDLAMTRFSQWWRRTLRFGYAASDVVRRTGHDPFARASLRARAWGIWLLLVPLAALPLATAPFTPASVFGGAWLLLWPSQLARIAWRRWRAGTPAATASAYAFFVHFSNFPQLLGQAWFWIDRHRGRGHRLIEHKAPSPPLEAMRSPE